MVDRRQPEDTDEVRFEPAESYTITELEQVKALSEPLRLRLIECFCEERTTKQVADLLEEKPTRLYHHVDALERVGLIRQVRTRRNRGTLEKYYLAVARLFKVDERLFAGDLPESGEEESLEQVVTSIFDNTAREMKDLLRVADRTALEDEGVLSCLAIETDQKEIERLRKRIEKVVKDFCKSAAESKGKAKAGMRRYRLTLAFFPLDHGEP